MKTANHPSELTLCTLVALALVLPTGWAGGQIPVTWDGSTGDTLYGTADNWDISTVPLDAGLDETIAYFEKTLG